MLPPVKDALILTPPTHSSDMDQVNPALQQLIRDWSAECAVERDLCYGPILAAIDHEFHAVNKIDVKILVPGAGLCRLAFEIARKGYTCQANEFSFSMLLIANYILNKCKGTNSHTIYPWILQFSNNYNTSDQLTSYLIPDIDTSLRDPTLSMCAGDFLEVYNEKDQWDGLVTSFFLDTASNVIQYIEVIFNILKPGAIWLNIGPLLYHYSEQKDEICIELSYEQLRLVIERIGFIIEDERYPVSVPYVDNHKSMLRYTHECVFFKARKPVKPEKNENIVL